MYTIHAALAGRCSFWLSARVIMCDLALLLCIKCSELVEQSCYTQQDLSYPLPRTSPSVRVVPPLQVLSVPLGVIKSGSRSPRRHRGTSHAALLC